MQNPISKLGSDAESYIKIDPAHLEKIVFHHFYGGPLGGSTQRLGAALKGYLDALVQGHEPPDPAHKPWKLSD